MVLKRLSFVVLVGVFACGGDAEEADTDAWEGDTEGTGSSASASASGSGPSGSGPGTSDGSSSAGDTDPTGNTTGEPPADGPLLDRLEVVDIAVPEGVKAGVSNWRIWGTSPLGVAPVFTSPRPGCGTFVGFTTGANPITARVAVLDPAEGLETIIDLATGFELRGLAAESDTVFGALLWDPAAQQIFVRRFDVASGELSSTPLVNADNNPTDFGIGDSRLEYGDGQYGAYYHVHSDTGHEGDTLKWVDAASGAESTGWGWGCSHSMSNLLRFNPAVDGFMPACVTDCFPGTSGDFAANAIGGIYLNHSQAKIMDVDAGCNGDVAGELGGAGLAPSGWVMTFNAHQAPATPGQNSYDPSTMNQDIGFVAIDGSLQPGPVVWLTETQGNEDDAAVARWQPSDDGSEQYVVGWHGDGTHWLARVDPSGSFLEGPVDLAGAASWGKRDDPFRAHANGDVAWSWFDEPGSTTLRVARLKSGTACGG
jgi:hypothetical protein